MVKHVYLIKLKDRSKAKEVVEKIQTLQGNVPSILRVEAAVDFRGVKGKKVSLKQRKPRGHPETGAKRQPQFLWQKNSMVYGIGLTRRPTRP